MKMSKLPFSWGPISPGIIGARLSSDVMAYYGEKTGRCWVDIAGKEQVDFQLTRSEWFELTPLISVILVHVKRSWE